MVGNAELTLVIPTIFLHMSIGATFLLAFMKLTSPDFGVSSEGVMVEKQVVFFSMIIAGLSMLAALTHLGHPLGAWTMAFKNLPASWLGWESLFYLLFLVSLVAYYLTGGGALNALVMMTTGGLAVLTGAMIYSNMASVPAWAGPATIATFVITFLLLGAAFLSLFLAGRLADGGGSMGPITQAFGMTSKLIILLIIGALVVTVMGGNAFGEMFLPRLVLGIAIPLVIAFLAMSAENKVPHVIGILVLLVVGEILGRAMFYATASLAPMGGNGALY